MLGLYTYTTIISHKTILKFIYYGAGEMFQQLRAPITLEEDLGLFPRIHIVVHNHPYITPVLGDLIFSSDHHGHEHICGTYTHRQVKSSYICKTFKTFFITFSKNFTWVRGDNAHRRSEDNLWKLPSSLIMCVLRIELRWSSVASSFSSLGLFYPNTLCSGGHISSQLYHSFPSA